MAEDWGADVKKFAPGADDTVIAGIVRHCGIALHNRDSSLVSFTDPAETQRVRENFLKKKLGLTQPDDVLDQAIARVGERMKGVNFKNRVTVYYLLLEHFGMQHAFGKSAAAAVGAAGLGAAGLATVAAAANDKKSTVTAAAPERIVTQVPAGSQSLTGRHGGPAPRGKSGFGWWPWLIVALLLGALLWWLFVRGAPTLNPASVSSGQPPTSAPIGAPSATSGVGGALASAPVEGTAAIPGGAGVTVETRDGRPVVKVYFDTGKTDLAPAFADAATGLKDYLASHSDSRLAVSGFNDKTGNVAANAELSKNRAQAVKSALISAGVPETSVELVKPAETTDTSVTNGAARRVEVVVR